MPFGWSLLAFEEESSTRAFPGYSRLREHYLLCAGLTKSQRSAKSVRQECHIVAANILKNQRKPQIPINRTQRVDQVLQDS